MSTMAFKETGRAIGFSILSSILAAFLVVAFMIVANETGQPLIGDHMWFFIYAFMTIFMTVLICVIGYRFVLQEKIKWVF